MKDGSRSKSAMLIEMGGVLGGFWTASTKLHNLKLPH